MKFTSLLTSTAMAVTLLLSPATFAADAVSLDQLLEQTRMSRQREAEINKEREARFLAERDKQAAALTAARATLAAERARGASLSTAFDSNEVQLTELQTQLDARSGTLGEMFGVVRQMATDFTNVIRNSMISAQYPARADFISALAQSKSLPSIEDLEAFWFEIQREMTETGAVVKFPAKVVTPGGEAVDTSVVRIGGFNATSDGQFLSYLPSQQQFAIMPRQPGEKFQAPARNLERASSGYVETKLDPTRGVLLAIYAQRPGNWERIEKGEAVGYVILLVGGIGAIVALYQLVYLTIVRMKVKKQVKAIGVPVTNNPLGRVLASFKGDGEIAEKDAEVVELRISEAVLKEVPKLERFQSFLRLAVAAGPLLGLIGTVMGMIITFQSITESGSSDPKLMANGISQAMIATLLGLGIAVPLLFANAWLGALSRAIVQVLDEQSVGLLAARMEGKKNVA